jgi:FkbM family methyltransferase
LHLLLDRCLARVPRLYARLAGLRAAPNLEKICFLTLVRRGDVVVEAGANLGYYTSLFSHLVGPRGHVHAFEPVAPTFSRLRERMRSAVAAGNLTLNEAALGAAAGFGEVSWPGDDHGQASLVDHRHGSWQSPSAVHRHPCVMETLDGYAERQRIERVDFVKCDVEGAELLVLRGGEHTVRRFLPLLHLEVCRAWSGDFAARPTDVVTFLQALGYRTFCIVDGRAVRFLPEPHQALADMREDESANLICAAARDADRLIPLRRWGGRARPLA